MLCYGRAEIEHGLVLLSVRLLRSLLQITASLFDTGHGIGFDTSSTAGFFVP